jgi:predicted HAD superfamily phosphohydrolase YqeG
VGDQLFTDILGGNLFGAPTILVDLMQPEPGWFFRLKRRVERWLLKA